MMSDFVFIFEFFAAWRSYDIVYDQYKQDDRVPNIFLRHFSNSRILVLILIAEFHGTYRLASLSIDNFIFIFLFYLFLICV